MMTSPLGASENAKIAFFVARSISSCRSPRVPIRVTPPLWQVSMTSQILQGIRASQR